VAVQRNLTVRGIVDHEAAPTPPPKSKPLSERLIREMSAIERKRHPGKSKAELREIVIDKYAPRWKRK
jgi:hypothetical protein